MEKLAYFFIDDTIWVMRDLARQRPKSMFDNAFMKMLKRAHDDTGMTAQLNLFFRTDFFYGDDEFTLCEMPDIYKKEFEENSDWLKLAFHAKQEFPDYPYVNATYDDVKNNYMAVVNEIIRFAGRKSLSEALCPHWLPVSRAGCHALADCGVKFMTPTYGERTAFEGRENTLPYGHGARLLNNRQPETMLFTRQGKAKNIAASICSYNHISEEEDQAITGKNISVFDKETGIGYKKMGGGPCLNLCDQNEIVERLTEFNASNREFIGTCLHEQYFYPDYFAYIPDIAERVYLLGKTLTEFGYRWITADEFK